MKIFETQLELLAYLSSIAEEKTIGFIPTMGCLHDGHLKLIQESQKICDVSVCSIFINPKQFDNSNDFANYPRTLELDLQKLRELHLDIVYTPLVSDLYAKDEKVKQFNFGTLALTMEGRFRAGHFNGMATIVEKLFNIIKPTKAFFGQKDLQQLQIVKELAKQMNTSIEVVCMKTIREKNGLAKSSRNKLLSEKSKQDASLIYECLQYCIKNKSIGINSLKKYITIQFHNHSNLELEYIEFVELQNMQPIKKWKRKGENAICIAAHIGNVRLIDNIIL